MIGNRVNADPLPASTAMRAPLIGALVVCGSGCSCLPLIVLLMMGGTLQVFIDQMQRMG